MTFKDSRKVLTEEEIKKEANRCLGCGVSIVNQNRCLGCGLCTTRCKFDAVHIKKVHDYDFSVTVEQTPQYLEPEFTLTLKGKDIIRKAK